MRTKGVCSSCQSIQAVVKANLTEDELKNLDESGHDEEFYYAMAPHFISGNSGPECDGTGTMPQTVNIA